MRAAWSGPGAKWNDGTVRLKNVDTGKCISDSGGSLGMASCTTSEAQSFYVKHWNDGTMRFKNESDRAVHRGQQRR